MAPTTPLALLLLPHSPAPKPTTQHMPPFHNRHPGAIEQLLLPRRARTNSLLSGRLASIESCPPGPRLHPSLHF